MLSMIKGVQVPQPEKLYEGYAVSENTMRANVDAEKILEVMRHFIVMHKEPLFFILELPCELDAEKKRGQGTANGLHKNIYYIDGLSQEQALSLLESKGNLLVQDGMSSFGFGGHDSRNEIMKGKYNVVSIYSPNISEFHEFFAVHQISECLELITAWDTFTLEQPGISSLYVENGEDVYSLPEYFKEWGIYLAEERVEER
ncbi:MAG: hypothetical protein IJY09_10235 [Lachnospiraceae bacterium]|nr:hypothetical protein [Lachnospiraceae bacterium]